VGTSKRISLEELRTTPEYIRLTPKMKMFVDSYCGAGAIDGNFDPVAAVNQAYRCKSYEVARIMSYSILANIKIVAVLNRYFGTEPVDSFLENLDRAVRNKKLTLAQLGALRLQCDVLGLGTKIPANLGGNSAPKQDPPAKDKRSKKPKKTTSTKASPPPPPGPTDYDPDRL
jgi:hypothetical protein